MNIKEKINPVPIFFISILIIVFFLVERNQEEVKSDIANNARLTIGQVFLIQHRRSSSNVKYFFFFNGTKHEGIGYFKGGGKQYENNFYRVEFSSKNPDNSIIFLDQKVTDTVQIKNEGFTIPQ